MKVLRYMVFLGFAFSILSCQTITYTTTKVQTLNPPLRNTDLPNTANIAIVAMLNWQSVDSSLITDIAMSLKENLEASPKYNSYIFPVYTLDSEAIGLTKAQLEDIKINSGADYLIALEYFNTDIQKGKRENSIYYQIITKILHKASIKIYDLKNYTVMDNCFIDDTVTLITRYHPLEPEGTIQIPSNKEIVSIVGKVVAQSYAQGIAPYWQEEKRYYYINNEISRSAIYVENEEWERAMDIWLEHVDDNNKALAAICCFNMAVGCEMLGEYELALEWMENIKRKNEKYYWEEYKRTLEKRLSEKKVINRILN